MTVWRPMHTDATNNAHNPNDNPNDPPKTVTVAARARF